MFISRTNYTGTLDFVKQGNYGNIKDKSTTASTTPLIGDTVSTNISTGALPVC